MSESMRVYAVDVLFFLQNQTLKIRWLDFASKKSSEWIKWRHLQVATKSHCKQKWYIMMLPVCGTRKTSRLMKDWARA